MCSPAYCRWFSRLQADCLNGCSLVDGSQGQGFSTLCCDRKALRTAYSESACTPGNFERMVKKPRPHFVYHGCPRRASRQPGGIRQPKESEPLIVFGAGGAAIRDATVGKNARGDRQSLRLRFE